MDSKDAKTHGILCVIGYGLLVCLICYLVASNSSPAETDHRVREFAGQIQQSQRGDLIILTNGEIYAVVSVLDSNNVMLAYGRGDWGRGEIKYFAERSHAVIAENSSDAMRVKTAFYDQVVGRTNDPIRLHP